jgi:hypothetical protein
MRKEYSKLVKDCFDRRFKEDLPLFRPKPKETAVFRTYSAKVGELLTCYLLVGAPGHQNEFTIELAWSTDGRVPDWQPFADMESERKNGSLRFDLCKTWGCKDQHWWVIESATIGQQRVINGDFSMVPVEPFLPGIPGLVDDATARILEFGIPYLEQIALEHGYVVKMAPD